MKNRKSITSTSTPTRRHHVRKYGVVAGDLLDIVQTYKEAETLAERQKLWKDLENDLWLCKLKAAHYADLSKGDKLKLFFE